VSEIVEIPTNLIDEPSQSIRSQILLEDLQELAASIQRLGILQPLTVKRKGNRYEVVAGHRRLLAARMIGLEKVPCIVKDLKPLDELATMMHENIHREELNPVDAADVIARLKRVQHMSWEAVAEFMGKSVSWCRQVERLVEADPEIRQAIRDGLIGYAVGLEIMAHPDREKRMQILQMAIEGGWTQQRVRVVIRDDLNRLDTLRELEPVINFIAQHPQYREIKGRCAICDQLVPTEKLLILHTCEECYNVLMEMKDQERRASSAPPEPTSPPVHATPAAPQGGPEATIQQLHGPPSGPRGDED